MATFNFDSIQNKAALFMGSSSGVKKKKGVVSDIIKGKAKLADDQSGGKAYDPDAAADKFIEVLHRVIVDHKITSVGARYGRLGPTAISAMEDIDYNEPVPWDDDTYSISVYFGGNLERKSLDPSRYRRGVYNIVGLLNAGYEANRAVRGVWEGHGTTPIFSLRKRDGAHFIQEAIDDFMGNYASEYGVVRIEVSGVYDVGGEQMTIADI